MSTATLTRESILAMEAGAEMDALVAERVMGWRTHNRNTAWWVDAEVEVGLVPSGGVRGLTSGIDRWSPSTDIAAAWEVMEAPNRDPSTGKRWFYDLESAIGPQWRVNLWDESQAFEGCARPKHLQGISGDTAPLAICRAALLATLEAA